MNFIENNWISWKQHSNEQWKPFMGLWLYGDSKLVWITQHDIRKILTDIFAHLSKMSEKWRTKRNKTDRGRISTHSEWSQCQLIHFLYSIQIQTNSGTESGIFEKAFFEWFYWNRRWIFKAIFFFKTTLVASFRLTLVFACINILNIEAC